MFLKYHQTIVIHLAECMLSNASHVLNYCQAIFIVKLQLRKRSVAELAS